MTASSPIKDSFHAVLSVGRRGAGGRVRGVACDRHVVHERDRDSRQPANDQLVVGAHGDKNASLRFAGPDNSNGFRPRRPFVGTRQGRWDIQSDIGRFAIRAGSLPRLEFYPFGRKNFQALEFQRRGGSVVNGDCERPRNSAGRVPRVSHLVVDHRQLFALLVQDARRDTHNSSYRADGRRIADPRPDFRAQQRTQIHLPLQKRATIAQVCAASEPQAEDAA